MSVQEQIELACSLRKVQKHNGAGDNFNESNPFNEGRSNTGIITEADPLTKRKEALVESTMTSLKLTEAAARDFLGLKPKGPEGLTRLQEAEYKMALRFGLKHEDALIAAKMPLRVPR